MSNPRTVLVIGGGLAGLTAAHTALEHGAKVILIDKKPSFGGNSVKASSGINGAVTDAQKQHNIEDSVQAFYNDTERSAGSLARPELIQTLTSNSAAALTWLSTRFNVDLSIVSRLGGHSIPRTHRGQGGAPGWAMTSALIKKLEQVAASEPERVKTIRGAKATELLENEDGGIIGVQYEIADGKQSERADVVILTTGGYAADFADGGYLSRHRPDLLNLPTASGDHATGDGLQLATSLQKRTAALCDIDQVQVHPTGFVDPKSPSSKTKILAAEALRGAGGMLVDKNGERFANELDKRDVVTAKMLELISAGRSPIWLLLGEDSANTLKTHCDFYLSKGLMKRYTDGNEFTRDKNLPSGNLAATFASFRSYADGQESDPFGRVYFDHRHTDIGINQPLLVAEITPVVHYTMGGVSIDASAHVLDLQGVPIPGLFAAGEVIGGVHGENRLGGSSLLEAIVFGRIAGEGAMKI
ncbi:fumarate reductase [Moniliophthora roreri]|nr:fumarate reductase [Moniliophthora roreri]